MSNSDNKNHVQEKESLTLQFKSLIEKCRNRFVNRYELATENDPIVHELCTSFEQILGHGLRPSKSIGRNKILGEILSKNRNDSFSTKEWNINDQIWNFAQLFLTEHEVERFKTLRNVHTDFGRARSWIRNSLNEHSLEKYLLMMLENVGDKTDRRKQFYYDWALIQDDHLSSQLLLLSQSLNSVLFALDIDNENLDQLSKFWESSSNNLQTSSSLDQRLAPIIRRNENQNILIKSDRKKTNLIIIDDDISEPRSSGIDSYARSAPVDSFFDHHYQSSSNKNISTLKPIEIVCSTDSINNDLSYEKRSASSFSINDTSMNLCLYPISTETEFQQQQNINQVISRPSTDEIRALNEQIDELQRTKDRLTRENNLLNIQIKKYIATIELMKFNQKQGQSSSKAATTRNDQENKVKLEPLNDIESYEKKLIQVSEMHGEVVEFNEHLYKIIQIKDSIISRLRNELIELRGPLPDNDETMSISTATDNETNTHSLQSLPQPLIHIWIPTAFLSGGFKGKSHHIYQIYVRIKEEEWNVYRRYSQFHSLQKLLRQQYPGTKNLEFPPKKAIGNKDSKVVQERRKKLEAYLRNVINHIQMQNNDISNKERFITILPFLSDKYFLQDRSQSESNLIGAGFSGSTDSQSAQIRATGRSLGRVSSSRGEEQSTSSRNYMGF